MNAPTFPSPFFRETETMSGALRAGWLVATVGKDREGVRFYGVSTPVEGSVRLCENSWKLFLILIYYKKDSFCKGEKQGLTQKELPEIK